MVDVLGTKLGRYDIRERLGKGGMAAVYKGWDTNLDRWVAVKVLHDYLAEETGFKERFEREAKVVASLNHPNIVQVYDFNIEDRNGQPVYYMVMTYITGQSLKGVMDETINQGERLTIGEIENVMRGVCSALGYAHARGMVHRDVTPGNILFNDNGQAVLADFGIARLISGGRLTATGATTGTPMYMPPEQGMGVNSDHRSDIYSLGVILYEMLSGQAPYNADSAVGIIMKHINEPVPSLLDHNADLSPELEAVVLRALAKSPDERYESAQAFLEDFLHAINGGPITATLKTMQPVTITLTDAVLKPSKPITAPTAKIPWLPVLAGIGLIGVVLLAIIVIRGPAAAVSSATATSAETSVALVNPMPLNAATKGASVPAMTQAPLVFADSFGADREGLIWPITNDDPQIVRNISGGVYHIKLTAPTTALSTVFDPEYQYPVGFVFEGDFTISSSGQPDGATGIIFRYLSDDKFYVFGINGIGQVSIWLRSDGQWTELRHAPGNWTPAEGAKLAGETNHLKLIDNGKQIQAYVNDIQVIDLISEPVIAEGAIGIYVATTSSTKIPNPLTDVQVDNFSAAYYVPATQAATESATQFATESAK
jgi:hypothetical protein